MTAALFAVLTAAQSLLGLTAGEVGAPDPAFWCHDLVNAAVGDPGRWTGPNDVGHDLVDFEPTPGGIVLTDLGPANDSAEHVAVIETVHEGGLLTVVQGNGFPDPEHVTVTVVRPEEVHATGITETQHDAYRDEKCRQLQEVKPWIDWSCSSY